MYITVAVHSSIPQDLFHCSIYSGVTGHLIPYSTLTRFGFHAGEDGS
jgi:hypothetical protein